MASEQHDLAWPRWPSPHNQGSHGCHVGLWAHWGSDVVWHQQRYHWSAWEVSGHAYWFVSINFPTGLSYTNRKFLRSLLPEKESNMDMNTTWTKHEYFFSGCTVHVYFNKAVAAQITRRIWRGVGGGEKLGERALGRPRKRCVDNINMNITEQGRQDGRWMQQAQDRV
jgi:hypothetical protein